MAVKCVTVPSARRRIRYRTQGNGCVRCPMSRAAQAYSLHQRCPMTPSRPNVVIATPCYGGLMTHVYVNSLLKLMGSKEKQGFGLGLFAAAHDSLITRSRNALVKSFLDATAATHLLFIDADIGFEPSAVLRLLQFDVEVAAGMYPLKVVD